MNCDNCNKELNDEDGAQRCLRATLDQTTGEQLSQAFCDSDCMIAKED